MKKIISVLFIFLSLLISINAFAENDSAVLKKGDLNGDGIVDRNDKKVLVDFLLTKTDLSEQQRLAADFNGDGKINFADMINLIKYLKKVITVKDFGAKGDGVTDDTESFSRAIAYLESQNGGTLIIASDSYINTTQHMLPENTIIKGNAAAINGKGFTLKSGCGVEGINFTGTNADNCIEFDTAGPHEKMKVKNCSFNGYSIAVYINRAVSGNTHKEITIEDNEFTNNTNSILVLRCTDSLFAKNTFKANTYNIMFFGGRDNRIENNRINGGITGVAFVFHYTTAGAKGVVKGNTVMGNTIEGVTEESISFDVRGANANNMGVREVDTVASKSTDGSSHYLYLTNPNWTTAGIKFNECYAVFITGALKGSFFKITAHLNDRLTIADITTKEYDSISTGDLIAIGLPMLDNTVIGNTVDASSGLTSIMIHGFGLSNTITGNTVYGKDITIRSLAGLNPKDSITGNFRKAPSMNNVVAGNIVQKANIDLDYINYAVHDADYYSYGNVVSGNSIIEGRLKMDRNENKAENNKATFADEILNPPM